jgi:F-type H+-transporting ATPase subunit epsilon
MPLYVEIVSREKRVFELADADSVQIPASEGEMGVLPNHAPVLTTLGQGELVIRRQGREERFVVYGGVVDVRPNKVTVLADFAESSFALDMEAIDKARDSAEKMMREGVPESVNRQATLALRHAELAAKVSRKMRQGASPVMRILDDDNGDDSK